MIPIGWRLTDGEWVACYAYPRTPEGECTYGARGEVGVHAGGAQGGWSEAVAPPLPVLTLHEVGGTTPSPESVGATGVALPMDVDGDVFLRVFAGSVAPGTTLRMTGASRCEFGHWHPAYLSLTPDTTYDVAILRGQFGPDSPTVTATGAGVYVTAYYLPPAV